MRVAQALKHVDRGDKSTCTAKNFGKNAVLVFGEYCDMDIQIFNCLFNLIILKSFFTEVPSFSKAY